MEINWGNHKERNCWKEWRKEKYRIQKSKVAICLFHILSNFQLIFLHCILSELLSFLFLLFKTFFSLFFFFYNRSLEWEKINSFIRELLYFCLTHLFICLFAICWLVGWLVDHKARLYFPAFSVVNVDVWLSFDQWKVGKKCVTFWLKVSVISLLILSKTAH